MYKASQMTSAPTASPSVLCYITWHFLYIYKLQQLLNFLYSSLPIYSLQLTDFRQNYLQNPFLLTTHPAANCYGFSVLLQMTSTLYRMESSRIWENTTFCYVQIQWLKLYLQQRNLSQARLGQVREGRRGMSKLTSGIAELRFNKLSKNWLLLTNISDTCISYAIVNLNADLDIFFYYLLYRKI